jgi:glycosyltransferase involved in cell wall biosynthesis
MLSIVIPQYNRFQMTIQSFEQILQDPRVDEVFIVDDCSTDDSYKKLYDYFRYDSKVKLYKNETNVDCYENKKRAIELASCHWAVLADSDNIFGLDYIETIFNYTWDKNIILTPSWAAPHFDFREYEGLLINQHNVSEYVDKPMFSTMLNAANFFVNRQSYLDVWTDELDPVTSDSIWFAYNWLKAGKSIFVTPNLTYTHRVHDGSHYKNNVSRTPNGFHESVIEKLKQLH